MPAFRSSSTRVVSLVPSWTETLIECGVSVVGRTRYCIHPADSVSSIPVVGGTKKVDWDSVRTLDADLLLLDRDENLRSMAEESPIEYHATEISSIADCSRECRVLGNLLKNDRLVGLADRYDEVLESPIGRSEPDRIPGALEWIRRPRAETETLLYVIWQDPWMAASAKTYIGSVLHRLGLGHLHLPTQGKYPVIEIEEFDADSTLLLFSTEPFPFHERREGIVRLPHPTVIVDGERFSWFGSRSLRFLEEALRRP